MSRERMEQIPRERRLPSALARPYAGLKHGSRMPEGSSRYHSDARRIAASWVLSCSGKDDTRSGCAEAAFK
jgi:hypothetical protein